MAVLSVAVPALALVGTCTAYYGFRQQGPDPVASSVASYSLHALTTGTAQIDGDGVGRLPDRSPSVSATTPTGSARTDAPGQSQSPAPASSARPAAARPALACSTASGGGGAGSGMLPLNYATIVNFLVGHGYTAMGAVGIAGNIYQESKGNPESVGSGGGGLIGWTPLPSGFVTGDSVADLQTQLTALLSYNQQWAQYLPMLNAATSPTDAAYIYMAYFERPGIPAASSREGAAAAVAQACGIGS